MARRALAVPPPAAAAPLPVPERETLALGVLTDVLGYHVAQAAVTTYATFEQFIGQPFGLRKVEYSLLMLLLANGPLSPKRLGQALALSAPNLTLLLDRLQERGLLRRERSAADRRVVHLQLTAAGRAASAQVPHVLAAVNNDFLQGFSEADWAQLRALVDRMAANGAALLAARSTP